MSGRAVPPLTLSEVAAHPDALTWAPFRDGVRVHWIYEGASGSCALLWYAPGAGVPMHEHTGWEHITVLSGAQEDEAGRYPAGCFVVNAPGSRHSVRCPDGALVLVVWSERVRFV